MGQIISTGVPIKLSQDINVLIIFFTILPWNHGLCIFEALVDIFLDTDGRVHVGCLLTVVRSQEVRMCVFI